MHCYPNSCNSPTAWWKVRGQDGNSLDKEESEVLSSKYGIQNHRQDFKCSRRNFFINNSEAQIWLHLKKNSCVLIPSMLLMADKNYIFFVSRGMQSRTFLLCSSKMSLFSLCSITVNWISSKLFLGQQQAMWWCQFWFKKKKIWLMLWHNILKNKNRLFYHVLQLYTNELWWKNKINASLMWILKNKTPSLIKRKIDQLIKSHSEDVCLNSPSLNVAL